MNNRNRKPLIGLIALSAALAMPMAFAQSDTAESAAPQTEQPSPTEAATPTEAAPPAESATGASMQSTEQAAGAASSEGKQGWADVDTDKDGAISKQEAASNAGLSQVFDEADADTDGKLTAEEYKAFVSKNYGDPKTKK
ncbi:MAG: EF-hand domain-containing protein [Pseudoxanthomonas sp.]